jgi:hypothetical protein
MSFPVPHDFRTIQNIIPQADKGYTVRREIGDVSSTEGGHDEEAIVDETPCTLNPDGNIDGIASRQCSFDTPRPRRRERSWTVVGTTQSYEGSRDCPLELESESDT